MDACTPPHPEWDSPSLGISPNQILAQLHVNSTGPSGVLSNAQNFMIKDSQFNDFGLSGLDILQKLISKDALYDGGARYPPPRCHPGTREKLLKTITDWVNDPVSSFPVMWLYGPAGVGKSAIAQTIAEKCDHEGRLAASFFFLKESEDRGTAMPLFPTLAWQLARSIPSTVGSIESVIRENPLLPSKSIDKQFNHLIVQPLKTCRNDPIIGDMLVVIDGVDECAGEDAQRLLLKLIGAALQKKQIRLRFLICSRPETHIKETFDSSAFSKIARTALLDNSIDSLDDIRTYFLFEFSRIREERRVDSLPWPSENVIEKLVYDSSGQFIYATTVIKFVDDKYCDPRKQLEIVLGLVPVGLTSPFAELDQLYITILSQQPDRRVLREVLMCTIGLIRPSVRSISEILGVSEDELRWKLRGMHSLLRISDLIETYHASIHDFLQDPKRAGEFYLDPEVIFTRYMKPIETLKQFAVLHATHDSPARDPRPRCHPGTRKRVLAIIDDWIDEDDVRVPIMWLHGSAGSGKSAIAQTIAERCNKDGKLAASYFFLRTKLDYDTADPLFPTLAWQLVYSVPETAAYIASAVRADPLLLTKSLEVQVEHLIVRPLEKALGGSRPKTNVVVIDGIGECGDERAQRRILKLVTDNLVGRVPLRFLISSRVEAHITKIFLDVKPFVELDDYETLRDIQKYLEDELARTRVRHGHVSLKWLDSLDWGSQACPFLCAATIIMFIEDTRDYSRRLKLLSDALGLGTGRSIDSTVLDLLYAFILSRSSDHKSTMVLLRHVATMPRPSVRLLSWRLGISDADLCAKVRDLHPLLHISGDIVEAYHLCFLEYLRDKKRAGKYYVSTAETTLGLTRLATAYFAYSQLPLVGPNI